MKIRFLLIIFLSSVNAFLDAQNIYFVSSSYNGTCNIIGSNKIYSVSRKDSNEVEVVKVSEKIVTKTFAQQQKKNFLFYIHGYGKSLEEVYLRAVELQTEYDVYVVVLWWSSLTPNGKRSNLKQAHSLIKSDLNTLKFCLNLQKEISQVCPLSNFCLLAHSLGNYFLELLAQDERAADLKRFNNLILNSAAVNDEGHDKWINNLSRNCDTYVMYNNHDFVLRGLQLLTRSRRPLGLNVKKERDPYVHYFDFSDIVGKQHPRYKTHSYFSGDIIKEKTKLKDIYHHLFNGDSVIF